MENNDIDNIELRSEKVRHIIGKVPPVLVRTGTFIITIIVIALAVAFYTIRYPITIAEVSIASDSGHFQIGQKAVGQIIVSDKTLWQQVFR